MRTLIVDADSLIYVAATTHETSVCWEPEIWTTHGDFDAARAHLDDSLRSLQEKLEADKIVVCLSDYDRPWRKQILPSYKANRAGKPKPVLLKPLRDYCHEVHQVFQRQGLEGDDVTGILATAPKPPPCVEGERVIVSIDKDLKGIPGLHLLSGGQSLADVYEVSGESADRFHLTQALTGDQVDGYKGCPGVGPKKAEKILGDSKTVTEMWPKVVSAYATAGLSEEVALTQARVARICRASDFDFQKREVILWNPSGC